MEKKLQLADQSNYEIVISFDAAEKDATRKHVLQHFAKDMNIPGFRPGTVPLTMVEQKVDPKYVNMAVVEHLVNEGIQSLLKENSELKLIGEPYGFKTDEDTGKTKVTFYLDYYPEVVVEGEQWKKEKIAPITITAEAKEIDDAILNIRKNYADYQDADTIASEDTISKIGLEFFNAKGESVEKGTTYLGEAEFLENPFWKKQFVGKKKGEVVEISYDAKKLPPTLHAKNAEAKNLKATLQDIKKVVLPELNDEMILKLFGKEAEVKTYEDLKKYVEQEIEKQKYEHELIHAVENYILAVRKAGLKVVIPQTMINEEFKVRMKNLEERFGSAEKVEEYLKQLGDKAKEFVDSIKSAASESLEKFFILNKIAELLGIEVDWADNSEPLGVEKQLYEKLVDAPKSKASAEKSSSKDQEEKKKK